MFKVIQADFFRLFRSKGFWINQILFFIFLVVTTFSEEIGSFGVKVEEVETKQLASEIMTEMTWTSDVATMALSSAASFISLFSLALFVMIIGHDLTRHTYKNILAVGVSRVDYFCSKFVMFMVVEVIQFIMFYGVVMIIAGIIHGPGSLNQDFWQTLSFTMAYQYINVIAIYAIATLFLYALFSNVAGVMAVLIIPIIITLLKLFMKWDFLTYFDFATNHDQAWGLELGSSFVHYSILAALSTIIVGLGLSFAIFNRKSL